MDIENRINNSKIEAKVPAQDHQNTVRIRSEKINLNQNIIKNQNLGINNTVRVEVIAKMDTGEIAKIWIHKDHIKASDLIHLANTEETVKVGVLAYRKKTIKILKNTPINNKKVATVEVVPTHKIQRKEIEIKHIRNMIWMRNTINSSLIQKIK